MDSATIVKSLESVTAKWTKQRKQEERGQARSRREAMTAYQGPTIKSTAWAAIPEAYAKASSKGTLPASARQIYYAARKAIMEATGKPKLIRGISRRPSSPNILRATPSKRPAGM